MLYLLATTSAVLSIGMYICLCLAINFLSTHLSRFIFSVCTKLIESNPPPTTTSIPSLIICFAAVAIAIIPDEHCLSNVIPLTVTGSPAVKAAFLATLQCVVPCCKAAPIITSSTFSGSTPDLLTASSIAQPAMVGAVVLLNVPLYDFVKGVLAVETITASLIFIFLILIYLFYLR